MTVKKINNPKERHPSAQESKSRVTNVTLSLTTYGTEAQRNITIKKLEEELLIKGFQVKISTIRTISTQ